MKLYRWQKFVESLEGDKYPSEIVYFYSNSFYRRVQLIHEKVGTQNPIPSILLDSKNNKAVLDNISFIDLANIEEIDKITFIQLNRIIRDNSELIAKYPDFNSFLINSNINKNSRPWKSPQRTQMTIGRFVSRILQKSNKGATPKQIEEFVNSWKAEAEMERGGYSNLHLVSGNDITYWYNSENYFSNKGQLGSSCMRYEDCEDFFGIYVENPEVCKLLIKKSSEDPTKIVGRVLIWTLNDGEIYMDRVYTNNDWEINYFNSYYKEMGGKLFQWEDIGDRYVQLKRSSFDQYPYMDTFKYLDITSKRLYSSEVKTIDSKTIIYILDDTDGEYGTIEYVWSKIYQKWIDVENSVNLYGSSDDEGQVVYSSDATWVPLRNYYALRSECVFSKSLGFDIEKKNSIEITINSKGDLDVIDNNLETIDIKLGNKVSKTIRIFLKKSIKDGSLIFRDIDEDYREVVERGEFYDRVIKLELNPHIREKWDKIIKMMPNNSYLFNWGNILVLSKVFMVYMSKFNEFDNNINRFLEVNEEINSLLETVGWAKYSFISIFNNIKNAKNTSIKNLSPLLIIIDEILGDDNLDLIETLRFHSRELELFTHSV
jgi:hypothetical protein